MGFWTKKSISELQESSEKGEHRLRRTLGASQLILLGIGAIIGAGLFSITGIAAAENAGPAIVISFIIAAIGCSFAGLCYSELVTLIPIAGSAYTYAYATMGELIAWIIGWDLILEYAIGAATVSISWSAYVVSLFNDMGIHLPTSITASPWQPIHYPDGTMAYGYINLPALLIVAVISGLLILGIKESALFNTLIVTVKVSIVIIFIVLGYFFINPVNYHPFIPPNTGTFGDFGWSGIFRAAGVVFFAYIGFDAVSTAVQETVHPKRNLPIGILGSLFICTILYILFSSVMTGLVSYKRLNVAAPVALAINQTPFHWLHGLITLAILTGFTSVILVMLLGQSRILYAMSRDGFLPPLFSDIHPLFRTPWRCNLVLLAFVGGIGSFASLATVAYMTSIGTLLAFVIVCTGVLVLRYTHPEIPRPFKTPFSPFVPLAGIGVCLALMIALEWESWVRLMIWLILGMMIYFFYGRHRTKQGS